MSEPMNVNTCSAECIGGMCGACRFEDCACECHLDEQEDFEEPTK
jgi:hypothetical protein